MMCVVSCFAVRVRYVTVFWLPAPRGRHTLTHTPDIPLTGDNFHLSTEGPRAA